MTSPVGFLDFFVLEASEYIEQLDSVLLAASGGAPDAEELRSAARALRGSATMAKLTPFADLAGAVEQIGRALRAGALPWEPALAGAITAAVDDLKILLRSARSWTPTEDQRARLRTAELGRFAPTRPLTATPAVASGSGAFLGAEASNIAAGLELVIARPADREGAGNVLRRVRALRGVAAIREVPLLADVAEAAEQAAKSLELGLGPLSPDALALLRASAAILRDIAAALREGRPSSVGAARDAFFAAQERFHDAEASRERIVPIAALFYDDGGPQVVSAAPNPPTAPADRFRLELVSQLEHLRGLVAEARQAPDEGARARMGRELRRTLRALAGMAESFGERAIAARVQTHADVPRDLDARALAAIDEMAAGLAGAPASPATPVAATPVAVAPTPAPPPPSAPAPAELTPYVAMQAIPATPVAPPVATPSAASAPSAPTSAARPTPARGTPARGRTPVTGEQLAVRLQESIAGLDVLSSRPLTPVEPLPELPPVPIHDLVYRGRAALDRAIEIREAIRRQGGAPSPESLAELFDLLDLAAAG